VAKKLEIERKYLLRRVPELKWNKVLHIKQLYLKDGSRIRSTRDATPTKEDEGFEIPFPFGRSAKYEQVRKKKLKPGVYEEDEKEISESKYFELEGQAISAIKKVRYIYKISKKLKWEIDLYQNIRMVTAEIELPKEGASFKMPDALKDEIIMDVTEFPQFTNRAMSIAVKK
jgi:hypothetical protein